MMLGCFFIGGKMKEALLGYVIFLILFSLTVKSLAFLIDLIYEVYPQWKIKREIKKIIRKNKQ